MQFTGKDKDFVAIWDCNKQQYDVYKNDKHLSTKFRFRDIESYLN